MEERIKELEDCLSTVINLMEDINNEVLLRGSCIVHVSRINESGDLKFTIVDKKADRKDVN